MGVWRWQTVQQDMQGAEGEARSQAGRCLRVGDAGKASSLEAVEEQRPTRCPAAPGPGGQCVLFGNHRACGGCSTGTGNQPPPALVFQPCYLATLTAATVLPCSLVTLMSRNRPA